MIDRLLIQVAMTGVPAFAEAWGPGLSCLTAAPEGTGLEAVVCTQVPLGAFQCTGTGAAFPEVIAAATSSMMLSAIVPTQGGKTC